MHFSSIILKFLSTDGRPQWEVEGKIIREKCQGVRNIFFLLWKLSLLKEKVDIFILKFRSFSKAD